METEVENRKSSKLQLQTMIRERQAELDRLVLQADSLSKVHVDQKALIESLSNK